MDRSEGSIIIHHKTHGLHRVLSTNAAKGTNNPNFKTLSRYSPNLRNTCTPRHRPTGAGVRQVQVFVSITARNIKKSLSLLEKAVTKAIIPEKETE